LNRSILASLAQTPARWPLAALLGIRPKPHADDTVTMVCIEGRRRLSPEGEIQGLAVAVGLVNTSSRSVVYEIERIATTLDARADGGEGAAVVSSILPPGVTTPFTSEFVWVEPLAAGRLVTGTFELVLRYGRPDGIQRQAAFNYAVSFKAGPAGEIAVFRWSPI
jgi:hypothetical protein